MTEIIVVANAKGGAGKTTTTIGLAAEAAYRGKRTLVIDADTQGNATEHLIGIGDPLQPQGDGGKGLYRLLLDGDPVAPVEAKPKLDLIPAGPRTQSLADDLARMFVQGIEAQAQGLAMVRSTLHAATAGYDLVIIDTPPSEQSGTLIDCFLAAGTQLLIPFKPSPEHAFAAYKLLGRLVRLDEKTPDHVAPLGVVMFDLPAGAKRIAGGVEDMLAKITAFVPLFETVITHRQGPAAAASRHHLTPRELIEVAPSAKDRLRSLRSPAPEQASDVHVSQDVAERFAKDFADLYDEIESRLEQAQR